MNNRDCGTCKFAPRHWRTLEPTSGAPWREGLCAMRGMIRHGSISNCRDWQARPAPKPSRGPGGQPTPNDGREADHG
jgi:hypothetical protein